jgi:O-antigen/teichoic acid export membrane protein
MGFGVYSLLIPSLTNAIFLNFFYWPFAAWKPKILLNFPKAKDVIDYGKNIFGADLNSFLLQNVDFFIIGKFLSIPILGFYKLAFSLAMALVAMLGEVISRVTMPTFSLIKDHIDELQSKFQQSLDYISAIATPLFSILMVSAPIFIPLFYGGKWNDIILPFQIFCVLAYFSVLNKPCNSLLNSIGKPYIRFRLSLVFLPVTILFVVIGLRKGLIGVTIGYSSATLLYLLNLLYLTTIQLNLRFPALLKRLLKFFIPAVSMILISVGLRSFLLSKISSAWFQLFITLGSSIIFYFIVQFGLFPIQAYKFYGQILNRSIK